LKKKNKLISFTLVFFLLVQTSAQANIKEELINKFSKINSLSFNFSQKIGDEVEFGSCFIKYPLLMKCEYPKKKKYVITNGKKFAIVKKRYKKIYLYPLKKTPLFYLLNKDNILDVIKNYNPIFTSNLIQYKLIDNSSNILNIFFDKKTLDLVGWKTIDAYSNEVNFLIRDLKTNIKINNKFFKIPKEEDL
tara:strand:- start:357 stop:929 length:573 start_codon:yes stop_codon:yes gene_type:complete